MNCRSESVIANWESVIVHRLSVPSRISLDRDERNFQNLPWLKLSIGWSVSFIHDKKRRKRDVLQRRFSNCFTLVIILSLALSCTLREEKPYTVFFTHPYLRAKPRNLSSLSFRFWKIEDKERSYLMVFQRYWLFSEFIATGKNPWSRYWSTVQYWHSPLVNDIHAVLRRKLGISNSD